MRICLLVNPHREDAVDAAIRSATWLSGHGVSVVCDDDTGSSIGFPVVSDLEVGDSDLVICFGGDGTLIRAAHLCSEKGTPILGVYFGRFGFVTQCEKDELVAALAMVVEKRPTYESRMMIQTDLIREDKVIVSVHALNETVLQRAATDRMMIFRVAIDGQQITSYPADGVLVATPTGSTAYNLSAGGPIVDPNLEAMILTAIAPHTLSARPLVLQPSSTIELSVQTSGDAVLSVDGQTRVHLLSGDKVRVSRSTRITRLYSVAKNDFLEKLSHRLFYGRTAPEVVE